MKRIKEKLEEIEEKIKTLEVADVALHKLISWFDPNDYMNRYSAWYFGEDEPINKRKYLKVSGVREVVGSLRRGNIASREGSILEEKKAYESLLNLSPDKVIEIIRETSSKEIYSDKFSEIFNSSLGCFQDFNIYLVSTKSNHHGCGIHIRGTRRAKNKYLDNLAGRLHKSVLFNSLVRI